MFLKAYNQKMKTILMPNYRPSRWVLRWIYNVRSPKPWNTKHGITQYFRFTVDMFFVLNFFNSLMCVWLKKTTVLFICNCTNESNWLFSPSAPVHKILQWIESSDFNILFDICTSKIFSYSEYWQGYCVTRNSLRLIKLCIKALVNPSIEVCLDWQNYFLHLKTFDFRSDFLYNVDFHNFFCIFITVHFLIFMTSFSLHHTTRITCTYSI